MHRIIPVTYVIHLCICTCPLLQLLNVGNCPSSDDFVFCKQCQEQGLHTEHLDQIHYFVIPEISGNIYCRSCGHVFRTNQNNSSYQCIICDDGYILCLKCHNDGMLQKHFHFH